MELRQIPPRHRLRVKQRLAIATFVRQHGVRAAARRFGLDRRTVRQWRDRWKEGGPAGLGLSLNGQTQLNYTYDDANRLTSIARGAQTFAFGYDDASRRTSLTSPNGISTSYSYDELSRLTKVGASLAGTPVTSLAYTYDANGNRTAKTALEFAETYAYDSLSRLTAVQRTGAGANQWQFGYDGVGNRVSEQVGTNVTQSSFNARNQLLATSVGGPLVVQGTLDEPASVKVNGQDARSLPGNVFEATINAAAGTNTFTVEATDSSANVRTNQYSVDVSGSPASFSYDANGNLTSKTDSSGVWPTCSCMGPGSTSHSLGKTSRRVPSRTTTPTVWAPSSRSPTSPATSPTVIDTTRGFVVMERFGIRESCAVDRHFTHRFVATPGPL